MGKTPQAGKRAAFYTESTFMHPARPSRNLLSVLMWIATAVVGADAMADLDSDSGIWGVVSASGSAAALSPKLENFR